MKALAIAALVSVVVGLFVAYFGGMEFFLAPAIPLFGVAALLRTSRTKSALVTALVVFVAVLGYIVVYYAVVSGVDDRAANPNCDEICISKAEHWRLLVMVAAVTAAFFAVPAALIARFFVKPNERVPTAG